ncbi:UNVERIFIED_CONTAM: hypothetical protein GTU68_030728 [Idotea baltica]|nr:hypothetical protein [Idotea baltica]
MMWAGVKWASIIQRKSILPISMRCRLKV